MSKTSQKGKKKTLFKVDQNQIDRCADVLRALAHPLRLRIMEFIDKNQVINVNKIYNTLKLEQSITSQHLKILRQAGLVNTRRDGKFIFYSINYDAVHRAVTTIDQHL
jgi:DNA-binding transcriptional ArsR family regulator